jgi:predicted PurR-regulated permease PerM
MLIGWFIDENILAPLVRAGTLEMNPIVVMFAFLMGAQMAGAIGAMLAIPVAAVIQAFVMESINDHRAERGWPKVEDAPPTPSSPPVSAEQPST